MVPTLGTFSASAWCGMTRTRTGATTSCLSPGAAQPPLLVFSSDPAYGDSLVTESGVTEQHIKRVDQRLVTAPIDGETPDLVGLLDGVEIAEDVRAAEGVDRLLGVADQDQRGVSVERAVQDFPLNRVGVLELVHHDDAVALPETIGGSLAHARGRPAHRVAASACRHR